MASVEELIVKLTANNTDLKAKLNESEKQVGGFGGALKGIGMLDAIIGKGFVHGRVGKQLKGIFGHIFKITHFT